MSEVIVAGIGQTPVGEHWDQPLHSLATRAIRAALHDAGGLQPQAMYIGNFGASVLSHQSNLGALLTEHAGLGGIEAYTLEAAGASGAAAFRMGYLAVASGFIDTAIVVGVEKYTDMTGSELEAAAALSQDYDYEGVHGSSPLTQAALLAQRYFYEYDVSHDALAPFALLAHANAVSNPNAMFRKAITKEGYAAAGPIAEPLNLYDAAPYADGAAAIVLTRSGLLPDNYPFPKVRVIGSSTAIDTLALHDRPNPLAFAAVRTSVERACRQAGCLPQDMDFLELSDAFSIYALLSLEAAGYCPRGEGWKLAQAGTFGPEGQFPLNTFGGLKGRGNPLGAAGVYQLVEATLQLRSLAGANQVLDARRGLVQSLGGPASTVITHILEAWNA